MFLALYLRLVITITNDEAETIQEALSSQYEVNSLTQLRTGTGGAYSSSKPMRTNLLPSHQSMRSVFRPVRMILTPTPIFVSKERVSRASRIREKSKAQSSSTVSLNCPFSVTALRTRLVIGIGQQDTLYVERARPSLLIVQKLKYDQPLSSSEMVSLEQMPQIDGVCDECGNEYTVRIWPDNELRAIETGGACTCGSLSFHRPE